MYKNVWERKNLITLSVAWAAENNFREAVQSVSAEKYVGYFSHYV